MNRALLIVASFVNPDGIRCETEFTSSAMAEEWKRETERLHPGFITNWSTCTHRNGGKPA